jgi:hypothetical protein
MSDFDHDGLSAEERVAERIAAKRAAKAAAAAAENQQSASDVRDAYGVDDDAGPKRSWEFAGIADWAFKKSSGSGLALGVQQWTKRWVGLHVLSTPNTLPPPPPPTPPLAQQLQHFTSTGG